MRKSTQQNHAPTLLGVSPSDSAPCSCTNCSRSLRRGEGRCSAPVGEITLSSWCSVYCYLQPLLQNTNIIRTYHIQHNGFREYKFIRPSDSKMNGLQQEHVKTVQQPCKRACTHTHWAVMLGLLLTIDRSASFITRLYRIQGMLKTLVYLCKADYVTQAWEWNRGSIDLFVNNDSKELLSTYFFYRKGHIN